MSKTPEGAVKDDIKKWLMKNGFWLAGGKKPAGEIKGWMYMPARSMGGTHGIPDFCGIYEGTAFYIEAKAPNGGVVSENQKKRHEEIRAAGGIVAVISDVKQLDFIFSDNATITVALQQAAELKEAA